MASNIANNLSSSISFSSTTPGSNSGGSGGFLGGGREGGWWEKIFDYHKYFSIISIRFSILTHSFTIY